MAAFDFVTGFTESKGNTWEAIWDGFSLAIKNFFGAFLDLGIMLEDAIKWVIKKIAGFFGFDEAKVGMMMKGFSIFKPIKKAFNAIVDWIVKLMTNPLDAMEDLFGGVANVGKWIFDMALKPLWDWFKGMFPNLAAFIEPLWGMIGGLGTWIYDNALKPLWTWFKNLFDFSSFGAGLATAAKLLFLPFVALMDLVGGIWDWFMGLFGWEKAKITDDGQTVSGKLGDLLLGVWDWFLGLFGVGAGHSAEMPADDGQTVMGKLLGLVTGVWTWFKGLFDFSSVGAGLASAAKLIFLPLTALLSLVTGVWTWFKGLFGFSSPEEDADSAKGVGGFLNDLIGGVWGYFKKLFKFGSIGDVMKSYFNLLTFFPNIIKDAIAGVTSWLLGLFGFDEAAKTVANAQNFSLGDMVFNAINSIWLWFKDLLDIDIKSIAKMIPGAGALLRLMDDSQAEKNVKGMTKIGLMKSDEGMLDEDQIVDISKLQSMMKGMSFDRIKSMARDMQGINESDIMGKGDEIANWEIVQKTLLEGLKSARSGEELAAAQRETNELAGSTGAPVIIQDNSQTTSNSSQPLVLPTAPITPGNGQTQLVMN